VKSTKILATILAATLFASTGCGVSDSIKSLLLTSSGANNNGFYNLPGVDATVQLKVFAVYHSGKQIDVTNDSTWNVTPVGCATATDGSNSGALCSLGGALPPYGPDTVPINKTGLMTGIVGLCTWIDAIDSTTGKPASPPVWEYTGYYQTTASYRGFTSQPVGIGVGVVASPTAAGCGPA